MRERKKKERRRYRDRERKIRMNGKTELNKLIPINLIRIKKYDDMAL